MGLDEFEELAQKSLERMVLEMIKTVQEHIARTKVENAGMTSIDPCQSLELWKYFADTVVPNVVEAIVLASCALQRM